MSQFQVYKTNAYPISDLVNNPEINDISMVNPIRDKLHADFEFLTKIPRPSRMHKEKSHSIIP